MDRSNMHRLNGKYALITGASQGLGRALAVDFAREGAVGISLAGRNTERLEEVSRLTRSASPKTRVLTVSADLSRPEEVERLVAETFAEFHGRLDVLVNVASTLGPVPMPMLVDYPLDGFRRVLDTNLTAPFLLIQKVLPAILESQGSIINVTSDAGKHGYPGWGAYGISKFGIEGLSQTWASELEETGVRVNVVDPGNMNTAMHRDVEPDEDPTQWANPESVTEVFLYLASDESRGVNGRRFLAQSREWMRKRREALTATPLIATE